MKRLIKCLYFLAASSCMALVACGMALHLEWQQGSGSAFSSTAIWLIIATFATECVTISVTSGFILGAANPHFRAGKDPTEYGSWPIRRLLLNLSFWFLAMLAPFGALILLDASSRPGLELLLVLASPLTGMSAIGCLALLLHLHMDYPPGGWRKHLLMGSLSAHAILLFLQFYGNASWVASLEEVLSESPVELMTGVQAGLLVTSLAAICYVRNLIRPSRTTS